MNKQRILLVEDEAIIAISEKETLERYDFDVILAFDGKKAIELVKNDLEINLVLMDINLGTGIQGTEAAERILEIRELPIVFFTSHSEKEYVEKVKKITKYGYILKASAEFVQIETISMAFELFNAHKKTKENEKKLQVTLQSIGDAVIATDINGNITQINKIAQSLTGWDYSDAIGKPLTEVFKIVNSYTRKIVVNPVQLVLESGVIVGLANHTLLISKDGKEYQIKDSGSPIQDDEGKIIGIVLVFRDVTKEFLIQEKLRIYQEKIDAIYRSNPAAITLSNLKDGRYIEVNNAFTKLIGWSKEEAKGKTSFELGIWAEPAHEQRDKLIKVLEQEGFIEGMTLNFRHKNGTMLTGVLSANIIKIHGDTFMLASTIPISSEIIKEYNLNFVPHKTITDKEMEEKSENTQKSFTAFMETAIDAFSLWDADLNLLELNPAALAYFPKGTKKEDVIGLNILKIEPTLKENGIYEQYLEVIRTGQPLILNEFVSDTKWKGKTLSVTVFKVRKGIGMIVCDVSHFKLTEKKIANLLQEKELILKEVHHRIKNDLEIIKSLLSLQARRLKQPEIKKILNELKNRIDIMSIVYNQLYIDGDFKKLNLKEYLKEVVENLNYILASKARLKLKIDINIMEVSSRVAFSIGIILNELITNAYKYAFTDVKQGLIEINIKSKDHDKIYIDVFDNGVGISEEIISNKKFGFGLILVDTVVKQHEGNMKISRQNGTLFQIHLNI